MGGVCWTLGGAIRHGTARPVSPFPLPIPITAPDTRQSPAGRPAHGEPPSASTEPSHSTVTQPPRARRASSLHDHQRELALEARRVRRCVRSRSVMPATGSSRSSSFGSCTSSMPISSHCFWPCRQPGGGRPGRSGGSAGACRRSCPGRRQTGGRRGLRTRLSVLRASVQVLEHRVVLEDRRLLNLRPMPGDLGPGHAGQVDSLAKEGLAAVGPGLPVMTSIIGLPGAVRGPMMQRGAGRSAATAR